MNRAIALAALALPLPSEAPGQTLEGFVQALDGCVDAVSTGDLSSFDGWNSYAPLRFISPDASAIAGLGVIGVPGGELPYCLVSPKNIDMDPERGPRAEIGKRVRDGHLFPPQVARDQFRTETVERFADETDIFDYAVACHPSGHAVFIKAEPLALTVTLLPRLPEVCTGAAN